MRYNIKKVRELVIEQQILKNKLIDAITNKDIKGINKLFKDNFKYIKKWAKFLNKPEMYDEVINKLKLANISAKSKILNNLNIFDGLEAKNPKALKRLKDKILTQNKLFTFTTKNGRRLQLEYYTNLVATGVYVGNKNWNTINTMKSKGKDLCKISSHINACPICQPLQGKIYSISGNGYPKLPLDKKYLSLHPGCWHYIIAL